MELATEEVTEVMLHLSDSGRPWLSRADVLGETTLNQAELQDAIGELVSLSILRPLEDGLYVGLEQAGAG